MLARYFARALPLAAMIGKVYRHSFSLLQPCRCLVATLWHRFFFIREGNSNEYRQYMFLSRNKKSNAYPCKPQFYYIKVGFKGIKIIKVCFRNEMERVWFHWKLNICFKMYIFPSIMMPLKITTITTFIVQFICKYTIYSGRYHS